MEMTAVELLVPQDLENHLIFNKKSLNAYDLQKEEITGILKSGFGSKIKEMQIKLSCQGDRDPNSMDIEAFGKKGKGKGKGKGGKEGKKCKKGDYSSRVAPWARESQTVLVGGHGYSRGGGRGKDAG